MDKDSRLSHKKFKELEKKLDRQVKEKIEEVIKEKLNKKEIDYDIVYLILEIYGKSKFTWKIEHFDLFDSKPTTFNGKNLPENNRECMMLGIRLGTMRNKMIYNLREKTISEKERKAMDDLLWNIIWFQWQESRMIYDSNKQTEPN